MSKITTHQVKETNRRDSLIYRHPVHRFNDLHGKRDGSEMAQGDNRHNISYPWIHKWNTLMPIPLTPLQPLLLLQQDDCAPDALESFLADFPSQSGGLSLEEFKSKARCEDFDDGFATYWYLGPLILSISADDPFYSLHEVSPLIAP